MLQTTQRLKCSAVDGEIPRLPVPTGTAQTPERDSSVVKGHGAESASRDACTEQGLMLTALLRRKQEETMPPARELQPGENQLGIKGLDQIGRAAWRERVWK